MTITNSTRTTQIGQSLQSMTHAEAVTTIAEWLALPWYRQRAARSKYDKNRTQICSRTIGTVYTFFGAEVALYAKYVWAIGVAPNA